MRRKQVPKLGQRTKLSLVTQSVPLEAPVLPTSPVSSASVGASLAVAEAIDSHESVGADWPARPEGVSDEVLYTEWLRLHTPKSSISGKKLASGVTKRTPASYSNIVLPKAYSVGDQVVALKDAYVISMADRMNRENASASSRYKAGPAKQVVKELANPKASAYMLECHRHRVSVWNKIVRGMVGKANRDHQAYSFEERISARRMEWHEEHIDIPWDVSVTAQEAANDASVVATSNADFVGPVQPVGWEVSVSAMQEDANQVMAVLEARRYNQRRRELEEAFSQPAQKKEKLELSTPQYVVAPVDEWEKKIRSHFWNRRHVGKWVERALPANVQANRKLLKDWNDVKGQNHRAVIDRSIQYQYMLKSIRNSIHGTVKPAEQISRSSWWKLMSASHVLPGHDADCNTYFPDISQEAKSSLVRSRFHYYLKRKRELEEAFASPAVSRAAVTKNPSKLPDHVYLGLLDRLVVEFTTARNKLNKMEQVGDTFTMFGRKWLTTVNGMILPA